MTSGRSFWCPFPSPITPPPSKDPPLSSADVVVMAVTSQPHPAPALGEVWITEWQQAGLLKPSTIKPVFATIERRLLIRPLGILRTAEQVALGEAVQGNCSPTPLQMRSVAGFAPKNPFE